MAQSRPIILQEKADQERIESYGTAVANGVAANPTEFPSPIPTPVEVKDAIKMYRDSIQADRDRSIATDEFTEEKRVEAITLVNNLISYAFFKVNGNKAKLVAANIEFPKEPTKKEISKLEVESSRMGTEPGSYFFRLVSKAGSNVIGVFRKDADGVFRLVDAFDTKFFLLEGQPSGSQTYLFKGKRCNKDWDSDSTSNEITVKIP